MTDGLVEDRGGLLDENMEKVRLAARELSGTDLEAFSVVASESVMGAWFGKG